jgi:hypothetical protein
MRAVRVVFKVGTAIMLGLVALAALLCVLEDEAAPSQGPYLAAAWLLWIVPVAAGLLGACGSRRSFAVAAGLLGILASGFAFRLAQYDAQSVRSVTTMGSVLDHQADEDETGTDLQLAVTLNGEQTRVSLIHPDELDIEVEDSIELSYDPDDPWNIWFTDLEMEDDDALRALFRIVLGSAVVLLATGAVTVIRGRSAGTSGAASIVDERGVDEAAVTRAPWVRDGA